MFVSLQKIIHKKLSKYGIRKQIEALEVCELADFFLKSEFKNMGRLSSNGVKAASFKNQIITVKVLNYSLCCELKLREQDLINKINGRLEKKKVKKINFVVGKELCN